MDECVASQFLKVQLDTWPLRRQLEDIKKYFTRTKPALTLEQHEKFKKQHQNISMSLDQVITQCHHARMDLSVKQFSQIDKYLEKAQTHLANASIGLAEYKLAIKNTTGKDFDLKASL